LTMLQQPAPDLLLFYGEFPPYSEVFRIHLPEVF
jgi:hypothetical protein